MSERLRLTITFEEPDEERWIVARVIEVPGAISQGRTRDEARANLIDALRLMLSPDDDDQRVVDGRSEPLELTLTAGETSQARVCTERGTRPDAERTEFQPLLTSRDTDKGRGASSAPRRASRITKWPTSVAESKSRGASTLARATVRECASMAVAPSLCVTN
jgi:predicted RNase H-like HicB family nuclease